MSEMRNKRGVEVVSKEAVVTMWDLKEKVKMLEEVLGFYADPETYYAIAFIADAPCGELMEDFEEPNNTELWENVHSAKPGKRARMALGIKR